MDLFPIRDLRSKTARGLKESRSEITAEIEALEGKKNLSSTEERGLDNLRESLDFCSERLAKVGDGNLVFSSDDSNPLRNPGGIQVADEQTSDKFTTFTTCAGQKCYGVSGKQRFVDLPTYKRRDAGEFGRLLCAHATGRHDGVAPEALAALSTAGDAGTLQREGYWNPVLDIALNQIALSRSGMFTIDAPYGNIHIAKVASHPVMTTKLENESFAESDVTFSGIYLASKFIGCKITCPLEMFRAPNTEAMLPQIFGRAIAIGVDQAGLSSIPEPTKPGGLFSFDGIQNTDYTQTDISWSRLNAAYLEVRKRNYMPTYALMDVQQENVLGNQETANGEWKGAPPALRDLGLIGTQQMASDRFVVGDFSQFAQVLTDRITIKWSDEAGEAFERHQRVYKVYWAGNFASLQDDAFQFGTLGVV